MDERNPIFKSRMKKAELIIALDVDTFEETRKLIDALSPVVGRATLKAAVQASREKVLKLHLERPFVVEITALTSDGKKDSMLEIVLERSELAKKVGYR